MGTLRFLLAISVYLVHSYDLWGGIRFVKAGIAVEAFFIISGFYMALILSEKYLGNTGCRLFYINRFLRLFPAYWLVFIITVTLSVLTLNTFQGSGIPQFLNYHERLSEPSHILLGIPNLALVGQDILEFLEVDESGTLSYSNDVKSASLPARNFLVIPQAWSLSLEIMFYMVAPFIVRRSIKIIMLLLTGSLAIKIVTFYVLKWPYLPWGDMFFPSELLYFLAGSISYRIYAKYKTMHLNFGALFAVFSVVCFITIFYELFHTGALTRWLYHIMIFLTLPFLFILSNKNKIDRFLGELSYPIYIVHITVIQFVSSFGYKWLTSLFLTMLLSVMLFFKVIKPIDIYRKGMIEDRLRTKPGKAGVRS